MRAQLARVGISDASLMDNESVKLKIAHILAIFPDSLLKLRNLA